MLSRQYTLIIGVLGAILFGGSLFAENLGLCASAISQCSNFFDPVAETVAPLLFLLILSIATYMAREEVYRAWFRFARWWIPLSIALILISPEYSHDWMFRIEKGSVALATSGFFVLVSLIIIVWKYWALRKRV